MKLKCETFKGYIGDEEERLYCAILGHNFPFNAFKIYSLLSYLSLLSLHLRFHNRFAKITFDVKHHFNSPLAALLFILDFVKMFSDLL